MKTDIFQWLDMAAMKPVYGVRIKYPNRGWIYCGQGGKPCLFPVREEAEMMRDFIKLSGAFA
jgi:hypothetical protein